MVAAALLIIGKLIILMEVLVMTLLLLPVGMVAEMMGQHTGEIRLLILKI